LSGTKDGGVAKRSELFPESLIWAIVSVFVVGLGSIIGLLAVMKEVVQFDITWIIGFTLLSFTLVFGVEGVLIAQLLRRKGSRREVLETDSLPRHTTKELDAAPALVQAVGANFWARRRLRRLSVKHWDCRCHTLHLLLPGNRFGWTQPNARLKRCCGSWNLALRPVTF